MKLLPGLSLIAAAVLAFAPSARAAKPAYICGTYQKGSNITEPRPKRSQFLQTIQGGIVMMGSEAGYYLSTRVIKKPEKRLFITVEFEDPTGRSPLKNEAVFEPSLEGFLFGSPDFVKGLRLYAHYSITVKIFDSRGVQKPIDTLRQTVRCYVDTRGPKAVLSDRLQVKP